LTSSEGRPADGYAVIWPGNPCKWLAEIDEPSIRVILFFGCESVRRREVGILNYFSHDAAIVGVEERSMANRGFAALPVPEPARKTG